VTPRRPQRSRGLALVAMLMMLFGLVEVLTSVNVGWFAHTFDIPRSPVFTAVAAATGVLYVVAGVLVLLMQRRAAAGALGCLAAVVAGRVALVLTGAYPVAAFLPALSVAIGTAIVVLFAVYVAWRWRFIGRSPLSSGE
jgi:hypothetical protein